MRHGFCGSSFLPSMAPRKRRDAWTSSDSDLLTTPDSEGLSRW